MRDPRARSYGQGFIDGVSEALDQLEGRSTRAPSGCYDGPLPDELRDWIAGVRARHDQVRAEDGLR